MCCGLSRSLDCANGLAAGQTLMASQDAHHSLRLAIQVGGALQPTLVGVPGEEELPALELIDHHPRHFRTHRRATQATTNTPLAVHQSRADIVRAVDNDGALAGQIVEARLQAIHAQGIAVFAPVALRGAEQPKTGLVTAQGIGEAIGEVFPRLPAVGDEVTQQQTLALQIENPQTALGGRLRIVDHRQTPRWRGTMVDRTLHGRQGMLQGLLIKAGSDTRQVSGQSIRLSSRGRQRYTQQPQAGQTRASNTSQHVRKYLQSTNPGRPVSRSRSTRPCRSWYTASIEVSRKPRIGASLIVQ